MESAFVTAPLVLYTGSSKGVLQLWHGERQRSHDPAAHQRAEWKAHSTCITITTA